MPGKKTNSCDQVNLELSANVSHNSHNEHKNQEALTKMIRISIICTIFLIVELIGGILANSLAIITDAAHLFSDLSGFVISIFAIYISRKKPNKKFTFGYHRAEILGALASVITIWILTGILIVEAIDRLRNPTTIDAPVMLLTAVIGLICNLAMMKVLHSTPGGHHHGCCHDKNTSQANGHLILTDSSTNIDDYLNDSCCDREEYIRLNGYSIHEHKDKESTGSHEDSESVLSPSKEPGLCRGNLSQHDDSHDHRHGHSHKCEGHKHDTHGHHHDHKHHDCTSKHKKDQSPPKGIGHTIPIGHCALEEEEENVNIKAALIHIIGDIIQSVGVVIVSIIIYFEPAWTIADPMCTFLFSFLVILTTIKITRQCMLVLLEAVPDNINISIIETSIKARFTNIRINNLQMWSLAGGKHCLILHAVHENKENKVREIQQFLKENFKIDNVTVQIETPDEIRNH